MNQILVPLDGSALAEQALPCAVMLGQGLSAEVVLFRAISVSSDVQGILDQAGPPADAVVAWLETEANEYLYGVADWLGNAGLKVRHVVRHGAAAEAIVDYAARTDLGQIVMATHGYSGLKRWTHGSVAERVLQAARVPVLLVRTREADSAGGLRKPTLCRRILVPLDGSELAEQVLRVVSPIARALESEIILFRVPSVHYGSWGGGDWYVSAGDIFGTMDQEAQAYLEHVASRLQAQEIGVSTATQLGPVAESIIEYAEANRVDLIAMCTHGRTGLARWALGSVAEQVLRAAGTPILLVRAR